MKLKGLASWGFVGVVSAWAIHCLDQQRPDPVVLVYAYFDANGDGRGDPKRAIPKPSDGKLKAGWVEDGTDAHDSSPLTIGVGDCNQLLFPYFDCLETSLSVRLLVTSGDRRPVIGKKCVISFSEPRMDGMLTVLKGGKLRSGSIEVETDKDGRAELALQANREWPEGVAWSNILITFKANETNLNASKECLVVLEMDCFGSVGMR